jgi:hypothetical protein
MIEVALSPAQFAELLTTMNSGPGVPGTLEKVMKNRAQEFKDALSEVTKIVEEKKALSKSDCKQIMGILSSMVMQFESNMPFYVGQFEEAAEKIAVQTKAEVDAFITHAVQSTGLETLRNQALQLTKKTDNQD